MRACDEMFRGVVETYGTSSSSSASILRVVVIFCFFLGGRLMIFSANFWGGKGRYLDERGSSH